MCQGLASQTHAILSAVSAPSEVFSRAPDDQTVPGRVQRVQVSARPQREQLDPASKRVRQ